MLTHLAETASLSQAAKRMGMSSMKAWRLVRVMNASFRKPLVRAERGGRRGGGAELTDYGREALALYRRMEEESLLAMRESWGGLRRMLTKPEDDFPLPLYFPEYKAKDGPRRPRDMKEIFLVFLFLWAARPAGAEEGRLTIAAAADLVYCLAELNANFGKQHHGADVKVSIGSSGNFFAQIKNGAPFDIFLSADVSFPRELVKAGLADGSSLTAYAEGRIVLWTTKPGIEVRRGLKIVNDPAVVKFAIANPEHAPYGRAAKAALEHARLWTAASKKLVLGENVAQTAQFVQTGNAEAGIVALSLVMSPGLAGKGTWMEIPSNFYPLLEQGAVITAHGMKNPLAPAYIDFLRSKEARAVLDRYGFKLPEAGRLRR